MVIARSKAKAELRKLGLCATCSGFSLVPVRPEPMASVEEDVKTTVQDLRTTFSSGKTRSLEWRRKQLSALQRMLKVGRQQLCEAMKEDLNKSCFEGYITEVNVIEHEVQEALDHLDDWAAPDSVTNNLLNLPGRSFVYKDPLGVILIIGAWNYPVQLSIAPLVGAIAAGCCAVLKTPSDKYSGASSRAMAKLIETFLDQSAIRVVQGDRHATQAVLSQRWDKIFYTGGCSVGKMVAESAAKHLTPTVLELGGKSPCIVDATADLAIAAKRICWGAFMNAGQTCVRPDYLFVHEKVADRFHQLFVKAIETFYSTTPAKSEWFGRIINARAASRLADMLKKDEKYIVHGGDVDTDSNFIAPTVLDYGNDRDAFSSSACMAEEIFGPIVPCCRYADDDDVVRFITTREKPLALYVFTTSTRTRDKFLTSTSSGGADVNDVIMHMTNSELPFGGVGNSGMGSYHGQRSFDCFTHHKAVVYKYNFLDVFARYPPYSGLKQGILNVLQTPRPRWFTRLVLCAAFYLFCSIFRSPLKALLLFIANLL